MFHIFSMCKHLETNSLESNRTFTMLLSSPGQVLNQVARRGGGRALFTSGLLFPVLSGAAMSDKAVNNHTQLFKFKTENSVPWSYQSHFKCSIATGYCLLDSTDAEYVHYERFYWTVLLRKAPGKRFYTNTFLAQDVEFTRSRVGKSWGHQIREYS